MPKSASQLEREIAEALARRKRDAKFVQGRKPRTPPRTPGARASRSPAPRHLERAIEPKPKTRRLHSSKGADFADIIRDDDPAAMRVAEDLLLQRGQKIRDVAAGSSANSVVIDMQPRHGTYDQRKMVGVYIEDIGRAQEDGLHSCRIGVSVDNGSVRVIRTYDMTNTIDMLRRVAAADAWAIAKAIKPLPFNASQRTVERAVDDALGGEESYDNIYNAGPEELF